MTSSSSVAVSVAGVGDHDLPLFAISCIHKHLRSASSQPGCYTVLYFYSLTTSVSFSFVLPCCQQMLYSFPFLITWPRNSACLLLTLLISFLVLPAVIRISKLVLFSVHNTLSILLKNHISIASMDVNVGDDTEVNVMEPKLWSMEITCKCRHLVLQESRNQIQHRVSRLNRYFQL